jgi:hypothetical protein
MEEKALLIKIAEGAKLLQTRLHECGHSNKEVKSFLSEKVLEIQS